MQLIRGKHILADHGQGCVATLGNFDGLHLGHQKLLEQLKLAGKKLRLPTVVIIFEPQPMEFFAQQQTVPRLMRFREKWLGLKEFAIDYVLCLRFNQALADLSPESFVKYILVEQLEVKCMIVGDDFHFGAKRAGDYALLKKLGDKYNFTAIEIPSVLYKDERVSSTRVRRALQLGAMSVVQELLGQPYRLCGKVIHGEKRGRDLGFPTANINLHREIVPLTGVFVIRALGLNEPYYGVANVGIRPTFHGTRVLLEVHLFDFSDDIYGHNLVVEFLYRLRAEKRYESFDALMRQIRRDVKDAQAYLVGLRQ